MQIKPNGQTPRDADGHPDLTGNWGAGFPNPIGQPGLRRPGGFEADQSAMQRGAQWNKPLYKPEYWEKVRSLDYGKADVDPAYGCYKPVGVPRQNVPGRIVQKNGQLWLLNNVENGLRILPLDNRKRDENDLQFSTYNGMNSSCTCAARFAMAARQTKSGTASFRWRSMRGFPPASKRFASRARCCGKRACSSNSDVQVALMPGIPTGLLARWRVLLSIIVHVAVLPWIIGY